MLISSNSKSILSILLLFFFVNITLQDCPVRYYPIETFLSYVTAEINYNPQLQNTPQNYAYAIKQTLSSTTVPKVMTAINAIHFDFKFDLQYNVKYMPTNDFGTLNFQILVQDGNLKWKKVQFNFIATTNKNIIANTLSYNGLSLNQAGNKLNLLSKIDIPDNMKYQPIVQTYISGIKLRSKATPSNISALTSQMQSLARYSWNINMVRSINATINAMSAVYFEITNHTIISANNTLSTQITFNSDYINIDNISISYVILNGVDFLIQNSVIYDSFTLNSKLITYRFTPLEYTDFTLIGLRGLSHKINKNVLMDFVAVKAKITYGFYNVQNLENQLALYLRYIQMAVKNEFQCQNCPSSIFRFDNFCLDTCPRSYINYRNGTNSKCVYCNLSQYSIPNAQANECVCAKQFYLNTITSECQACHYSCFTCNDKSSCLTCDSSQKFTNRKINQTTGFCQCADGYFQNLTDIKLVCSQCDSSCKTCLGSSPYQCTKCADGRKLDTIGRCICANSSIEENGKCICKYPSVFINGVCTSRIVTQKLCPDSNMIQTFKNSQTVCECKSGFTQYKNVCVSCPYSFVLNALTGRCQCPSNTTLNTDGLCITCDQKQQYDSMLEKCVCRKIYFQKFDGTCVQCPPKSIFIDEKCDCIFNYFWKNGECVKCNRSQDGPNCLRPQIYA